MAEKMMSDAERLRREKLSQRRYWEQLEKEGRAAAPMSVQQQANALNLLGKDYNRIVTAGSWRDRDTMRDLRTRVLSAQGRSSDLREYYKRNQYRMNSADYLRAMGELDQLDSMISQMSAGVNAASDMYAPYNNADEYKVNLGYATKYYGMSGADVDTEIERLTNAGRTSRRATDEEVGEIAADLDKRWQQAESNVRDIEGMMRGRLSDEMRQYYNADTLRAAQKELDAISAERESFYDTLADKGGWMINEVSAENQQAIDWLNDYRGVADYAYGTRRYGYDPASMKPYEVLDITAKSADEQAWLDDYVQMAAANGGYIGADDWRQAAEAQRAYDSISGTNRDAILDLADSYYGWQQLVGIDGEAAQAQEQRFWRKADEVAQATGMTSQELLTQVESIYPYVAQMGMEKFRAQVQAEASAHPWLTTGLTYIIQPVANLQSSAYLLGSEIFGGTPSAANPAMTAYTYNTATRGQVGADINKYFVDKYGEERGGRYGDTAEWVYNAVNSTVDSGVNMLITNGVIGAAGGALSNAGRRVVSGTVSNLVMGSGAASSRLIELKQAGYDDGRAVIGAISAGLAEGLTEAVGGEFVLGKIKDVDSWIVRAMKSLAAEGTEEVMSAEMQSWYDWYLGQDTAGIARSIFGFFAGYKNAGYDDREAFIKAFSDTMMDYGSSWLAGAFSGLLHFSAGTAAGGISRMAGEYSYARAARNSAQELASINALSQQLNETDKLNLPQLAKGDNIFKVMRTVRSAAEQSNYNATKEATREVGIEVRRQVGENNETVNNELVSAITKRTVSDAITAVRQLSKDEARLLSLTKGEEKLLKSRKVQKFIKQLDAKSAEDKKDNEDGLSYSQRNRIKALDFMRANGYEGQLDNIKAADTAKALELVAKAQRVGSTFNGAKPALDTILKETPSAYQGIVTRAFNSGAESQQTAVVNDAGNIELKGVSAAGLAFINQQHRNILDEDSRAEFHENVAGAYFAGQYYGETQYAKQLMEEMYKEHGDIKAELRAVYEASVAERNKKSETTRPTTMKRGEVRNITAEEAAANGVATVDVSKLTQQQKEEAKVVRSLAKQMGFSVVFFDSAGGAQEGWHQGGTIYLDVNAGYVNDRSMLRTMSHELTHFIQQYNRSAYNELRDFIVETYHDSRDEFENRLEQLMASQQISEERALDELIARGCEMMLKDSKAPQLLYERNADLYGKIAARIREWAQAIRNAIRKLMGDVKPHSAEAKRLMAVEAFANEVQQLWDEGLVGAVENMQAQKSPADGEAVQYEKRDFAEQVDEVLSGNFPRGNAVYVGQTPKMLAEIGLNGDLPMLTTAKHLRDANAPKNTKLHHHGIDSDQLKSIPQKVADPVMLMDSLDINSNSIVVVTDMLDEDKSPIVVSIKADGRGMYNNIEIDANFVTGYYGRDGFKMFVKKNIAAGNILYINKKKAENLSAESSTSWLEQLKDFDFDVIIRKSRASVKQKSLRDDEYMTAVRNGDMATAQRMVDEAAKAAMPESKITMADGRLRVTYHGTDQGDFTEFLWDKTQRADGGFYGRGHYFTSSKGMAEMYGGRVVKAYLNITNPFIWEEEVSRYNGLVMSNVATRNIVQRINLAKHFPEIYANKEMDYAEYDSSTGEYIERSVKWGDLEKEIAKVLPSLSMMRYQDGSAQWAYPGRFWDEPVGEKYNNAENAEAYKFEAAITAFVDTHEGIARYMSLDDQTSYVQDYGDEITAALKRKGYDGAMQNEGGTEIVAFYSSQIKSADPVTYDNNGNVIPLSERFNAENNDIRYSMRDSDNNQLTPEQQEFFKDSKVRDAQGRLLKVYHGTPKTFTTFRQGTAPGWGRGIYFTDNREEAQNYGENIVEAYLNITNPFIADAMSFNEIGAENTTAYIDFDKKLWARGYSEYETYEEYKADGLGADLEYIFAEEVEVFNRIIRELGYDGIIANGSNNIDGLEIVAFEPNQAKLTTNTNPTANPDIRYSARDSGAVMSAERIDYLIADSGAGGRRDYAQAWITSINPTDFLNMTLGRANQDRDRFDAMPGDYGSTINDYDFIEGGLKKEKRQTPYLAINVNTGEVVGHEGRHRMRALEKMGITYAEIKVEFWDDDWRLVKEKNGFGNPLEIIDSLTIYNQRGTGQSAVLNNIIPLNKANKDTILQSYGEAKAGDIQYSLRDEADMVEERSNREILVSALLSAAQTEEEQQSLSNYQARVRQLDAKEKRLAEVNEEIHKLTFTKGRDEAALNDLKKEKARLLSDINRSDILLMEMEAAAPLRALVERQRKAAVARAKAEGREKLRDYRQKRNESDAVNKYRSRVESSIKSLLDLMVTNTDKKHIPEALKEPIANFIEALDLTSERMREGGKPTKRDIDYNQRLNALRAAMATYTANAAKGEADGYLDLPDGFVDMLNTSFDTPVYDMSAAELRMLDRALTILKTAVSQSNELMVNKNYARVSEAGEATIADLDELGAAKDLGWWKGINKLFLWNNATPYYAFRRLGSAGAAMFESLQSGWDKLALNAQRVVKDSEQMYTAQEAREWGETVLDIELSNERTVKMTAAQAMSVYCLAKRQQGLGHLLGGGIKISVIDAGKGKQIAQYDNYTLTIEDLQAITAVLSERQRKVADKLQDYMGTVGAEWGNEVSMKRFGYRAFGEANYFPITSDPNNLNSLNTDAKSSDMFRLLNLSATKSLVKGANNAVVISNVFDVFAAHMADMAKYNALALPILDMVKWYNYKRREEVKSPSGKKSETTHIVTATIQKSLEKAFGVDQGGKSYAAEYIKQFIKDLNGVSEAGRDMGFISTFMGRYKKAAVAANLRVVVQQPMSYARALAVMDAKYLAAGAKGNLGEAVREMQQYSGIAAWKAMGFFDTNIGRDLTSQIKHDQTFADRLSDASMYLAGKADELTWGTLWKACKAETADKGYTGNELLEKTAERFREVVYSTQVVDATTTRSHLMRSNSPINKMWTAFMSEPTLTYNMMLDTVLQWHFEKRKGNKPKWRDAVGKNILRAGEAYVVNAVLLAMATALLDAWRDDDDFETFWEKYKEALGGNILDELNPVTKVVVLKDMWDILIEGGGSDRMDTAFLTQTKKAYDVVSEWFKVKFMGADPTSTTYYGKMGGYGVIYEVLKALGGITGMPFAATSREVVSLWNNTVGGLYPNLKAKTYNEQPELGYEKLYEAMVAGDQDLQRQLIDQLHGRGLDDEKIDDGVKSVIKDMFLSGELTEEETADQLIAYCGYDATGTGSDSINYQLDRWSIEDFKMSAGMDAAFAAGDGKAAREAVEYMMERYGRTESQIRSDITKYFKDAYINGSADERRRIRSLMLATGLYKADALDKQLAGWLKDK